MSIPPLVCSTPPPPDQCVDDKDPEDFDLSYSLSQDDEDYEDQDYNYGNFTGNLQSTTDSSLHEIKQSEITTKENCIIPNEINFKCENLGQSEHSISRDTFIETSDINENKLKCEDDINIEDLNLQLDEEVESVVASTVQNVGIEQNIDSVKVFNIPCNNNIDSLTCDTSNTSPIHESTSDVCDLYKESNLDSTALPKPIYNDVEVNSAVVETDDDLQDNSLSPVSECKHPINIEDILTSSVQIDQSEFKSPIKIEKTFKSSVETVQSEDIALKLDNGVVDDFDDFQSVNIETPAIPTNDNPWQNSDNNESDFGNFTANFEEVKFQETNSSPSSSIQMSGELEIQDTEDTQNFDDSDDFGDFDDFKSSSIKVESLECHELPVFSLQSTENEHQIMDRINKVLSSVFLEELSEPSEEFEGTLESLLSETWSHLKETDERQPYIINWNNSFGQKALLRALCIDSRNILFGPKWSYNMPKYAANLSNAPLKPQKQVSAPSNTPAQNNTVKEKPAVSPPSWRDPFTSDGEESCNTENESAAITPGPTDLDVFQATAPIKTDKIFSNTLGVQPLRQINLPDTHIFTPTDSEIPRSKTIHYDSSPTVILPQSSLAVDDNQASTNTVVENNMETGDSEYWDFQNFKSSDSCSLPGNISITQGQSRDGNYETAAVVNALPQQSVAYLTDLLQPIKVVPATPTLNWPDPGEVKGVFDDFSDFVSMSQQGKSSGAILPESPLSTEMIRSTNACASADRSPPLSNTEIHKSDDFDDDFDTFQSAYPSKNTSDNNYILGNMDNQTSSPECHSKPSKASSNKSDTVSFKIISKPNDALTKSVANNNTGEFPTNKNLLPLGSLLQPTPASSSTLNTQNQQKSGQILQPLSLESYSQINWPSPGIDLQDLSRFNPVETLHSLKSDLSINGPNKGASPVHTNKAADDDVWGEFVSSKPIQAQGLQNNKPSVFVDDDEWTDFISSSSVQPQNGLNTISLNVHTNSNMHKSAQNKLARKPNQPPLDIPTLNYITPKSNHHKSYNDKHFQNL